MTNAVSIYYATMTGTAEELARDAERRIRAAGWIPQLHNLSEASPASLRESQRAVFIVSTWGDGEPPDDAVDFYEELQESKEKLSHLNYALLGLGDSSYPEFNRFARDLDAELRRLDARPYVPRVEADADYDDTYDHWIDLVLEALSEPAPAS